MINNHGQISGKWCHSSSKSTVIDLRFVKVLIKSNAVHCWNDRSLSSCTFFTQQFLQTTDQYRCNIMIAISSVKSQIVTANNNIFLVYNSFNTFNIHVFVFVIVYLSKLKCNASWTLINKSIWRYYKPCFRNIDPINIVCWVYL